MNTSTQFASAVVSLPPPSKSYAIRSPYWMLKDGGSTTDWRKKVLHTRFKDAEELLIQKIREIRMADRMLTQEERETLITAFENFLHIHTLLLRQKEE